MVKTTKIGDAKKRCSKRNLIIGPLGLVTVRKYFHNLHWLVITLEMEKLPFLEVNLTIISLNVKSTSNTKQD